MGAIKDLVDLATQLDTSIKDRKMREALLPLKEQVVKIQFENLETERQHREEIECMKADHAQTVAKLESEHRQAIANAESRHQNEMTALEAKYLALVANLESKIPDITHFVPSPEHGTILRFLETNNGSDERHIATHTKLSPTDTIHYLNELHANGYVIGEKQRPPFDAYARKHAMPSNWSLQSKAFTYLHEHKHT